MYEIILSPAANRFYVRADPPLAHKLTRCLATLAEDPHKHPCITRLKGIHKGSYRYRLGDWRVVYSIDEATRQVHVLVMAHRREVYR